nr:putative wd repeat-containing protein c32h8.09 [Quercus suber]
MDISASITGTHVAASPSGLYIASVASFKLRVHATQNPERFSELSYRIPEKDITGIRWDKGDAQVMLISSHCIEILDIQDPSHRVRLDNGSGGLGRFSSADFVTDDLVLAIWEFGKTKLWNLRTGRSVDLNDIKAKSGGTRWQIRPCCAEKPNPVLAMLSRSNGDDFLTLYFPQSESSMPIKKLQTVDSRTVSWSADGKWIAVVDNPYAVPSLHIYTADGNHFRAYGPNSRHETPDSGVNEVLWSVDGTVLAVTRVDGTISLLNTRTFSPFATIEHNATINQGDFSTGAQTTIWEEVLSASGDRTYRLAHQPYSPPLSSSAKSTESPAKGVVDCLFSFDGLYLTTRDERMLNTVWIWDLNVLAAHAVIVQHSNVQHLQWHPSRTSAMLIDCGEGFGYLYDISSKAPPEVVSVPLMASPNLQWIQTKKDELPAILATTRTAFRVLYPEGAKVSPGYSMASTSMSRAAVGARSEQEDYEEGHSEDSLFDVLSGRKPQHDDEHDREMSYTERVDLETEEDDSVAQMDDTFREKRPTRALAEELKVDPLDDSQIF